jgi:hypothetical protein
MTQRYVYDYGGRADAGYPGTADGDCVTRALAIAIELGYRNVHDMIEGIAATAPLWLGHRLSPASADDPVVPSMFFHLLMTELPLRWKFHDHPTRFAPRRPRPRKPPA